VRTGRRSSPPTRTRRSSSRARRAARRRSRRGRSSRRSSTASSSLEALTLFGWVAAAGHPAVATGDFHRPDHLHTWKTLLPCEKDEEAVVGYLRSARPAFLARLDEPAVSAGDHDDQDRQAA
jgi:hypothetical protein